MRDLGRVRRVVVKIGSSSITHENGRLALRKIDLLAKELADLHNSGRDVILVSSGAIAAVSEAAEDGAETGGCGSRPGSADAAV